MCFSLEMSAAFAVLMWTYGLFWRNGPIEARLCIWYFASMETLQAFQYSVIGQCDNPINKFLTLLGFLHLAFQPFFVNLYLGCFMTKAQKIYLPLCICLSLFSGVLLTNRLWKTWGDIDCTNNIEPMCGPVTCSFRGDVHIAWQMPMQHADQDYFTPGFFHALLCFLLADIRYWHVALHGIFTGFRTIFGTCFDIPPGRDSCYLVLLFDCPIGIPNVTCFHNKNVNV